MLELAQPLLVLADADRRGLALRPVAFLIVLVGVHDLRRAHDAGKGADGDAIVGDLVAEVLALVLPGLAERLGMVRDITFSDELAAVHAHFERSKGSTVRLLSER